MLTRKNVKDRIAKAFSEFDLKPEVVDDLAFHMTDGKENLDSIVQIYNNTDLSDKQIREIVLAFLAHVPNHIAATKKLVGLGPIEDIFNVSALEEDE